MSVAQRAIDKLLDRDLDSLFGDATDTTIYFGDHSYYNPMMTYDAKGIGSVHIFQTVVLLILKKGNWKVTKYIYGFSDTSNELVVKSVPINLERDSDLTKLRSLLPQITGERFLPPIGKFEKNGIAAYDVGWCDHCPNYDLRVQAKQYYQAYGIEEIDFWEEGNLNYTYNTSRHLYPFYNILRKLTKLWDKNFTYNKQ